MRRWWRQVHADLAYLTGVMWLAMAAMSSDQEDEQLAVLGARRAARLGRSCCGRPASRVPHTEATDGNGRRYCSACRNWL